MISMKPANKVQNFTAALRALRDAVSFLEYDYNGRTISQRAGCWDEVIHSKFRIDLLATERPSRVCVLILGEFNSGKSTLINALVGQTVAVTDTFEMTSAVARIIPTDQGSSQVVFVDKNTNRPVKTLSLAQFLDFCVAQAEKMKTDPNAIVEGYTQARIFVRSELNAELVDTPGLGATLDNELNAADAVSTCDIVLWTVDAQNIGGAREAAMLDRIHESGQPLICALTKSDTLDAEDIESTVTYIADSYSVARDSIFAVSAEGYLRDKQDVGVNRLKAHIQSSVVNKGAMLREKALFAQASDISGEVMGCLTIVEACLGEALQDAEENCNALLAMADNVTERLCDEFAIAIKLQLQADMEKHLIRESSPLLEQEIWTLLQRSLESLNTSLVFSGMGLNESYKHLWLDGIKSELQMLQSSLSQLRQEAVHKAIDVAVPVLEKHIRAVEQKEKAIQHAMAAAGIFTGVVVGFGGNPLLGILAAVPELYNFYKAHTSADVEKSEKDLSRMEKEADVFFAKLSSELVEQQLKPELKKHNVAVVMSATDEVAAKNSNWPLSLEELQEKHAQCVRLKEQLDLI